MGPSLYTKLKEPEHQMVPYKIRSTTGMIQPSIAALLTYIISHDKTAKPPKV